MAHSLGCIFGCHLVAYQPVYRTSATLQVMDYSTEVSWLSIARPADIEFFLNKELGLERYVGLGVADADDATGKGYLVHCHLVCWCAAHSLDDDIGTEACGQLLQLGMSILCFGVNGVCGAQFLGQCQFLVINVGSYDYGTTQNRTYNCTKAHHAATDNNNGVDISNLSAIHGMETYAHRLYECTGARIEVACRDNLLPRQSYEFAHSTVTLNSQRLVVFAGVYPLVTARCTFAAIGVGIAGYYHSWFECVGYFCTNFFNYSAHLMSGYYGHFYHWIPAQPCIQVGTAESYILKAQ